MYSIKELADLAGTTTRTLRYYGELGLLEPAEIGENGYRYYHRANLFTLQQILFFRELDVPLKQIKTIMDQPNFQLLPALKNHHRAIQQKIHRYEKLLDTVQSTIQDLEGGREMRESEYFNGFEEKQYQEEAWERWGKTPQYQESMRKWSSYSSDEQERIKQMGEDIIRRMVTENPQARPGDPEIQKAVGDYYHYLNRYFYSCDVAFLRSLADMWVEDPRFAINYERIREGGAQFVRQAVHHFCDRQE